MTQQQDLKDIKIISILSQNSRTNYSQIGKIVALSPDSVKSRIEKLQKMGVLKAFKINLNYKKLGFIEYDIYFRFKNYTHEELKLIIAYLTTNKNTTWIATCFGKYDLRISIIVKENQEITKFIEDFENKFQKYFLDYFIVNVIEKYKIDQIKIIKNLFNTNKITSFKQIQKIPQIKPILQIKSIKSFKSSKQNKQYKEKLKLDNTNKQILTQLNSNPTISLVEISKNLNLTPEAIKYRINEMKKKQLITSFSITIDGNKLNKIWAVILFKLNNRNSIKFQKFIQNSQNISAFVKLLGNWNFSISVFANNISEIHDVLMTFRNNFPNMIKDYELILLFETYKYPSIPEVILKI